MTVIKNQKSNTYEVRTYYKDWTGVRKQKTKRGFKRKCDAQEWERAFKLKENLSLDMYFEDFVDLYLNDIKSRIKYNTWLTKKHIVETGEKIPSGYQCRRPCGRGEAEGSQRGLRCAGG